MSKFVQVVQKGLGTNKYVRPKSNTGSKKCHFRSTLRKDSVANYGSIWTLLPPSVRRLDVLYNALAPQDSQICSGNFPKCKKSAADLCRIPCMATIEIVCLRGDAFVSSCVFVLSPALHIIFHNPVAQYSLFVMKMPLDVNQPTVLHPEGGIGLTVFCIGSLMSLP